MLKVRRSKLYTLWFGWYSRRQFRRFFNSVQVFMDDGVREMDQRIPVIFYANHAYWWDGFWSQLCTEEFFNQRLHIIIELQQLQKHQFFTRIGAFSLDQSRPRTWGETIRYAVDVLTESNARQNALWIFPQGKIEHVDKRPLQFFSGTAAIARDIIEQNKPLYLASIVSRIDYLGEQKPELFLSFKTPHLLSASNFSGTRELTAYMQRVTEEHCDELRERIKKRQLDGAITLIQGSASINRRVEAVQRFLCLGKSGK